MSQIYKAGKPQYSNKDATEAPPSKIFSSPESNTQPKTFEPPSEFNRTGWQSDRAGLGQGRFASNYNAVPPPNFNSAATQTRNDALIRSVGVQFPGPGPRVITPRVPSGYRAINN